MQHRFNLPPVRQWLSDEALSGGEIMEPIGGRALVSWTGRQPDDSRQHDDQITGALMNRASA